jgi:hypothetical protein
MAEIEIKGLDALYRKLQTIEKIQDVLEPPMQRAVLRVQAKMAKYPPARPKSSYVRTGTLGRRWTTKAERTAAGVIGKVGNNTIYGPLVQSKQFQAKVHQGRWTNTDEQVLAEELPVITADFNRAVDDALK